VGHVSPGLTRLSIWGAHFWPVLPEVGPIHVPGCPRFIRHRQFSRSHLLSGACLAISNATTAPVICASSLAVPIAGTRGEVSLPAQKSLKRGLVSDPEYWRGSSFRAYAFGEAGPVRANHGSVLNMTVRVA
jgi:hypothetical protein